MPAPAVEPVETNSGGGEGRGRGEGGEEGGLSLLAQAVGLSTTVTKVTEGRKHISQFDARVGLEKHIAVIYQVL